MNTYKLLNKFHSTTRLNQKLVLARKLLQQPKLLTSEQIIYLNAFISTYE